MIKGLAHICFTVSDLAASLDFYQDKLGLEPAFYFTNEQGERRGAYIHVGGRNFVELFAGEVGEPPAQPSYRHFCLEVTDIEGLVRQLREKGLEVTDVKMGADHSWQAWLADPDGNRIELHQYTSESKQAPWVRSLG